MLDTDVMLVLHYHMIMMECCEDIYVSDVLTAVLRKNVLSLKK